MNTKIRQVILKILLLEEEFTKKELNEAVKFMSENKIDNVIDYLSRTTKAINSERKKTNTKSIKLLDSLKDSDKQKYKLLKELESLLQRGILLPKLDSIKKFSSQFTKEFNAGKSRKEAIPKLIELLMSTPNVELEKIINELLKTSGQKESEYALLADFLIQGKNKSI